MTSPDASAYAPQATREPVGSRKIHFARSALATVAGQFSNLLITTAGTMVLARMLQPADFGLLAMVYTLILFVSSFRDFGLPMAALQEKDLDHLRASALFWWNLRLTIAVTAFLLLMGPVLAWFYGEPALTFITAAMTAGIAAGALVNQHEALLTRTARFSEMVKWDVAFLIMGVVTAVCAAAAGMGAWALVAQFVVWQMGRAAAIWAVAGWRPAARSSLGDAGERIAPLISFGAYMTGFRVVSHISRDLDRVLVGYLGGAHMLGLYDAAYRWARLPVQQIYTPLLAVGVAGLAHVRTDAGAYRRSVQTLMTPVLALTFGSLTYAIVAAEPLILVLLGSKWRAAIPLFQWLCAGTIAFALLKTLKWFYTSMGQSKRQFQWGLISSPVFIVAIALGAARGPEGVAVAFAAANWALTVPGVVHCLRGNPLTVRQYFSIVALPAAPSATAAAVVWLVANGGLPGNSLAHLAMTACVYTLVFCASWLAIPSGRTAAAEMLQLLRLATARSVEPARSSAGSN